MNMEKPKAYRNKCLYLLLPMQLFCAFLPLSDKFPPKLGFSTSPPPNLISPSGSYLLRGKSAHVPLCVLGGWCHHPPNQHGYNQLPLSTCSMQLLPQEARSPHSFKAPTPLLGVSNVAGKFLMAKTNIIYVEGKRNETKRGGLHTLICFLT